jgi:hypothetical protein
MHTWGQENHVSIIEKMQDVRCLPGQVTVTVPHTWGQATMSAVEPPV